MSNEYITGRNLPDGDARVEQLDIAASTGVTRPWTGQIHCKWKCTRRDNQTKLKHKVRDARRLRAMVDVKVIHISGATTAREMVLKSVQVPKKTPKTSLRESQYEYIL